ncbi:MAG: insulinase family protein [Clostridia bacterium]|nr:insulinase family protein [Clostridia bacterium]
MPKIKIKKLGENITARNLIDPKFKTMRISVNMIVPLRKEYAACNALLPSIISRVTKQYPDYRSLSRYLCSLYGASLSSGLAKIGDNQVLTVAASGISNKYAFEGEDVAKELTNLICSAVFDPLITDECVFPEESLHQERRQLLETIDANYNDKKSWAKRRALDIFYEGEPASVSRYGTRKSVRAVTHQSLIDAWVKLMRECTIELFVSGDCDFDAVCHTFMSYLEFDREPVHLMNIIHLEPNGLKDVAETQDIAQSKLVMGFRTGVTQENSLATKLMSAVFGGTASSKLFMNVREKMSLCYYCGSRVTDVKGAMFVESGVQTKNIDAAREAILNQLQDMKDGKFTETDLHYAKLAMLNGYKSIGDSLYGMEVWYMNQVFNNNVYTPEEMAVLVDDITRIDVIEAARKVQLDTVYVLKGED